MNAKIKLGSELLFTQGASNDWRKLTDKIIINFASKYTYLSYVVFENRLTIKTTEGEVLIVFSSHVLLEFDSYTKDQLILKINNVQIF